MNYSGLNYKKSTSIQSYTHLDYFRTQRSYEPRSEKTGFFAYAKTKTQISFAVKAKLISAFVFAT